MTKLQFLSECGERFISPDIALENENIKIALQKKDDKKVIELLESEF